MIYLGIDCGRHTAIVKWDPQLRKFTDMETTDFWGGINYLMAQRKMAATYKYKLSVVIEDPNINKPVFTPPDLDPVKLLRSKPRKFDEAKSAFLRSMNIAQKVGRNKESAYLTIDFLKRKEIDFMTSRPIAPKWDAQEFKRLTGYEGRTNEHVRDAARLVWKLL